MLPSSVRVRLKSIDHEMIFEPYFEEKGNVCQAEVERHHFYAVFKAFSPLDCVVS